MSGQLQNWVAGYPITDVDMTRGETTAATADDLVYQTLLTPGAVQKIAVPLLEETASVNPRLLVTPGAVTGTVQLNPCELIAGVSGQPYTVGLAAQVNAAMASTGVTSNSSGSTRFDLLYATVQRTVSVSASRKIKDPNTGLISTQTVNLATTPTVTLALLANAGASVAAAVAALPADTGSAWNFPLAVITVANPYSAGTAIAQSAISQEWQGGWIPFHRRRLRRGGSIVVTQPVTASSTAKYLVKDRWGSVEGIFAPINYKTNPSNGIVLDNTIDWRRRWLKVYGGLPKVNAGAYQASEVATLGGQTSNFFSGLVFTGTDGAGGSPCYTVTSSGATFKFYADSANSGALTVDISGAANDGTNGDNWWIEIDGTDTFIFGAVP